MNASPLISVIMPVKNGEPSIESALKSIFAQSYRCFEVLLVDGRSTDNTAAIANTFPGVRHIVQQGNGIADATNTGIAAARGEYVSFLSHDDMWAPEKLRKQINVLLASPEKDYVTGKVRFFLQDPAHTVFGFRMQWQEKGCPIPVLESLLARKSLFNRIGLFPDAGEHDWFKHAEGQGILKDEIDEVLVYKRIHNKAK